ncbi:anthranilate synthase component I [Nesterenkonia sp. E16_7]|uniref:anthranilate synthase component I n=1 Tax=unclassified Nesterenkonia TaxID=2629769 RepID=UPI001A939DED|nr:MULTISPECIES: anthranilate synthase component I [unclassified Nesterenkonia]MBO0595133.1 anthranilate synthase component I [Nesterenkonia sp. E16_10]MBO0598789.1 anthranilate synthase component I [Nesterenkonia sp. E16_7]
MHDLGTVVPGPEEFLELAHDHRVIPVTMTLLADSHTPLSIYRALATDAAGAARPGTYLMESAAPGAAWSRHSFIGVRTSATLSERDGAAHWIGEPPVGTPREGTTAAVLRDTLEFLASPATIGSSALGADAARPDRSVPGRPFIEELPHLTSGLVGYAGWDVIRHWEKLPHPPTDDLHIPEMAMNLVSDLAVHDNRDGTVTLVANAINFDGQDTGAGRAYADAVARLHQMSAKLAEPVAPVISTAQPNWGAAVQQDLTDRVIHAWDQNEYLATLGKAKQAIIDGEVFQIVVSRRFEVETEVDALAVYRMLRLLNPSPYMYLMHFETPAGEPYQLVGASPEALVTVEDTTVVTHPIAGTRPRGETPKQDAELAEDLLADQKERAEHIMLVDLARNDLAKVCVPGSVQVTRFMAVERFSHVMHLTSHVQGELAPEHSAYDVLSATFPAGTLSGAPKPRALQLLDAWEPTRRGIYGGVVGYFDLSGRMDAAIAIRSALLKDGRAYVQAGGGIVADSDDDAEREETVNKAAAPLRAVLAADRLEHT